MLRHTLHLLLALALGLAPALGHADVYRWVDDSGVTHYTTDPDTIPRRFRGSSSAISASPAPQAAPRAQPEPAGAAQPQPAEAAQPRPAETEEPQPSLPEPEPASPVPSARAATPSRLPVFPGPAATRLLPPEDPRSAEVAELEAQIARDRETLRQLISTRRWDSAELASDPSVREIAERLPRLQAELEALRAETAP